MENQKRTVDSIENQRFFLITVCYENYLNDVKLEKIFLIDYFQNELNNPVIRVCIDDAVS